MEYLKEYVYVLVTIGFIASIAGLAAPDGSFKKNIKTVLGILVVLAVLGPILKLPPVLSDFKIGDLPSGEANAVSDMQKVVAMQQKAVFKKNMEEYIRQSIKSAFGKDAEVTAEILIGENDEPAGIDRVTVTITEDGLVEPVKKIMIGEDGEKQKKDNPIYAPVKKYISETFGVPEAKVEVM